MIGSLGWSGETLPFALACSTAFVAQAVHVVAVLRAGGLQLRRDDEHAAVCEPREEHQEQAEDQRGPCSAALKR